MFFLNLYNVYNFLTVNINVHPPPCLINSFKQSLILFIIVGLHGSFFTKMIILQINKKITVSYTLESETIPNFNNCNIDIIEPQFAAQTQSAPHFAIN